MPSITNPSTSVNPGIGPRILGGGDVAGLAASLAAHIADPINAHMATAIGYAGGPPWADGTTNPAATVEAQLDKILTDLGATSGTAKIHANAQTAGTITIAAGTLESQILALIQASNHNYAGSPAWANTTSIAAQSVEGAIDEIVSSLGGSNGVTLLGSTPITSTSVSIPAGTLRSQLVALASAGNIQYNGSSPSTWEDGSVLSASTVESAIDSVVATLGSVTGGGASGADKVGSSGTTSLSSGSVNAILNSLDTGWGKYDRLGTWSETQILQGNVSTGLVFKTDTLPTSKNPLWQVRYASAPVDTYFRWFNDRADASTDLTFNASWNGTNWVGDDTTAAAHRYMWTNGGFLKIQRKTVTSSPWTNANFTETEAWVTAQQIKLGDTGGVGGLVSSIIAYNGNLQMLNPEQTAAGGNPPASQGLINTLKPKNTVKAWGRVVNLNGGSISIASTEGLNVNTTPSRTTTTISVVFASALSTTPVVFLSQEHSSATPRISQLTAVSNTGFSVQVRDGAGSLFNPTTNDITFHFMVLGEQT